MELIRITCPPDVPESALDGIAAILDEAGVPAELITERPRMGAGIDPATILIVAPATAYLTTLAAGLARTTPSALGRLVRYVRDHLAGAAGLPVTLEIADPPMLFVYTADIPDAELAQRRADQLIRGGGPAGIYRWDAAREDWSRS
jgi:hypothetical protein